MKNKCEKYITKNNLWDTQMLKEKYPDNFDVGFTWIWQGDEKIRVKVIDGRILKY
tara:strand:+ start:574 stop:738 length:165 start_codon:yes stop_codon:yes gene_type:complete